MSASNLSKNKQQYGSLDDTDNVSSLPVPKNISFSRKKPLIGFAAAALALLGAGMVTTNKLTRLEAQVDTIMVDHKTASYVNYMATRSSSIYEDRDKIVKMKASDDCGDRICSSKLMKSATGMCADLHMGQVQESMEINFIPCLARNDDLMRKRSQLWYYDDFDGSIKLTHDPTMCLVVGQSASKQSTFIGKCSDDVHQKWEAVNKRADGYYMLENKSFPGLYLGGDSCSETEGLHVNMHVVPNTECDSFYWKFECPFTSPTPSVAVKGTPAPVKERPVPLKLTPAPVKARPVQVTTVVTPAPVIETPARVTPAPVSVTPDVVIDIPARANPAPVSVTPDVVIDIPARVTPAPVSVTPDVVIETPTRATPAPVSVTPDVVIETPSRATPAPVAVTLAPVIETPSRVTPAPVAVTPAPVIETTTRATPAPVSVTPAPVIEAPAPVIPAPITPAPVKFNPVILIPSLTKKSGKSGKSGKSNKFTTAKSGKSGRSGKMTGNSGKFTTAKSGKSGSRGKMTGKSGKFTTAKSGKSGSRGKMTGNSGKFTTAKKKF